MNEFETLLEKLCDEEYCGRERYINDLQFQYRIRQEAIGLIYSRDRCNRLLKPTTQDTKGGGE